MKYDEVNENEIQKKLRIKGSTTFVKRRITLASAGKENVVIQRRNTETWRKGVVTKN